MRQRHCVVGRICSNRELSASSKEIATVIKKEGLINKMSEERRNVRFFSTKCPGKIHEWNQRRKTKCVMEDFCNAEIPDFYFTPIK